MQVSEIQALMATQRVWGLLPEATRQRLAPQWQARYFQRGDIVLAQSEMPERLGWLLSGQVALTDPEAGWNLPLQPGELFGAGVQAVDATEAVHATAQANSQVLFLDRAALLQAALAHPALFMLLPALPRNTQSPALTAPAPSGNVMTAPISQLVQRAPVQIDRADSIASAARRMADERVSSILLTQDDQLFGVVTDRDLRSRVLAAGLDPARPVADIATLAPLTLQKNQSIFEAMVLMARQNIHHLPVLDGNRVLGMVTATDLNQHQSTSACS